MLELLDLLGRRWALRILWELREGPATFQALQARCDSMSSSVLSQRLAELREAGLVDKRSAGYALTEPALACSNGSTDWTSGHNKPVERASAAPRAVRNVRTECHPRTRG